MSEKTIAADIRDFVARYLDSVAELEALLLLHNNQDRLWTIASISERLYTTNTDMEEILSRLCKNGLTVFNSDAYRYNAAVTLAPLVDRVSIAYRQQLIAVTNLIHGDQSGSSEPTNAVTSAKDS